MENVDIESKSKTKKVWIWAGSVTILIIIVVLLFIIAWPKDESGEVGDQSSNQPDNIAVNDKEIPASYQIENVPLYQEPGFCYGASAMMIAEYAGLSMSSVDTMEDIIKNEGKGGPPDLYLGFRDTNYLDLIQTAYSKNIVDKEAAEFYATLIPNPALLLESENQALSYLKSIISKDIPVIVVVENGGHYVVATGYDENSIFINDPYEGKITMGIDEFLNEWKLGDTNTGSQGIGFPSDWGMIFIDSE